MDQNRVTGVRECARKARDLLQPMIDASDVGDGKAHESARAAIEQAWGKLLTVDRALGLTDDKMRGLLSSAFDALETASGHLSAAPADAWPETWRSRVAQARSLLFASGGAPRSVPPSRRCPSSMRPSVRQDRDAETARPAPRRKQSSPSLEIGELDLDSLAEIDPDLLRLLQPQEASAGDDRSGWGVLEVEVGFVGDNNFFAGLSLDVSEGGVFVATYEPRPVGTKLMLSFVLPGGHTITTPGVVRFPDGRPRRRASWDGRRVCGTGKRRPSRNPHLLPAAPPDVLRRRLALLGADHSPVLHPAIPHSPVSTAP